MDIKLEIGYHYTNKFANMVVVENPIKNSIKCKCLICGAVNSYKVSDLKEGKIGICKTCKGDLSIGKTYGGSLVLRSITMKDSTVYGKLVCDECGRTYILDKDSILSGKITCSYCNKPKISLGKTIDKKVETGSAVAKIKPVAKAKKQAETEAIYGGISDFGDIPFGADAILQYKIKGSFLIKKDGTQRSETGMRVVGRYRTMCTKCGTVRILNEKEIDRMDGLCKECESRNKDKRNILTNINWLGYVRNNLEVVQVVKNSDGGINCTLKCLVCAKKAKNEQDALIENIPLVSFVMEKEFICWRCANTELTMICPVCKKPHIKTTPLDLYCNRDSETKKFKLCGQEKVNLEEIIQLHNELSRIENLKSKYTKDYDLSEVIDGRGDFATILKFKQNYVGTDGQTYFTCMCEEHHKLMVLTEDEMRTYKHDYCADTRMKPYNPKIKPKISK